MQILHDFIENIMISEHKNAERLFYPAIAGIWAFSEN